MRTAIARVAVVRTEVVRPNATLLLVELVLPERHREFTAKWADPDMLLFTGSRERTASQYRTPAAQRLSSQKIVSTASPFSMP